MTTVVIDANCLMQIVPRRSQYRWILEYYRTGRFRWAYSTDILLEYEEVFGRWTSPSIVHSIIRDIQERPSGVEISPSYFWNLIDQDQDDNKYVDCAVAARANYIISDDRHFRVLNEVAFPKLKHITIAEVQSVIFDEAPPNKKS